jgi:hypothetical protein
MFSRVVETLLVVSEMPVVVSVTTQLNTADLISPTAIPVARKTVVDDVGDTMEIVASPDTYAHA